jgi:hypothetical protein
MRRVVISVAVLGIATAAHAQCTVTAQADAGAIALAQSLAQNSDSPDVRAAWVAHHCNIRKVMHGGGRPCRSGNPPDHVTIRVFGEATYHVFPLHLLDGHFCTTP